VEEVLVWRAVRLQLTELGGREGVESLQHSLAMFVAEKPAAAPERDISASRPYYQFLYQISKEGEGFKDELQSEPGSDGLVDIDTEAKAYESIKNI